MAVAFCGVEVGMAREAWAEILSLSSFQDSSWLVHMHQYFSTFLLLSSTPLYGYTTVYSAYGPFGYYVLGYYE